MFFRTGFALAEVCVLRVLSVTVFILVIYE